MENKCKRFLSLLLALVMVIGMMPLSSIVVKIDAANIAADSATKLEAGKTYVICFKDDDGAYYAVKSSQTVISNKGTLTVGALPDNYTADIGWTLVQAEGGYYLNAADDSYPLTLNGKINMDAFAEANRPGEVMTIAAYGDGYSIKNPSERYLTALNLDGSSCEDIKNVHAAGNGVEPDVLYFLPVTGYTTEQIPDNKITGSASSWVVDSANCNPESAFDGIINDSGVNTNYWHSNSADSNDEVYLIGALEEKALISKLVYYRRGAAYNSAGLYNGRVDSCTIYVTEGDVTSENYVITNDADLEWIEVNTFSDLPNQASNELVFTTPVAAKAVKMVVHKTTSHSDNNKIVTCGELQIYKNVCQYGHTYSHCIDAECDVCFSTRDITGLSHRDLVADSNCDVCEETLCEAHTEVGLQEKVDPDINNTGMTTGKKCSACTAILEKPAVIPATYNDGTVPVDKLSASVGSYQSGYTKEGAGNLALDDDFSTMWHTVYNNGTRSDFWIDFELDGNYDVTGLRYKPRTGAGNGTITKYDIQISYDGDNYVELINDGTWTSTNDQGDGWKTVTFNNAVQVQNIRLFAVESNGNDSGEWASAAELRLVGEETDHTHNFVGVGTATLSSPGVMTYTCICGASYEVNQSQLTAKKAQPMMDDWRNNNRGVVSLSDCEYVLTGTAGAYSLCHNGTYYVKIGADGTGIPQQNIPFAGLNLQIDDEGKLRISNGTNHLHAHLSGTASTQTNEHPWWNKCQSYHIDAANGSHDFYLMRANENSTNTDIPGYEVVTTLENAAGGSYLIAFANKSNGANDWYVMYPSTKTVSLAKVVETDDEPVATIDEFAVSYSNISMENDLKTHFAFEQSLIGAGTGYSAKITKEYADGRAPKTVPIPQEDWTKETIDGIPYYYVTFDGIAAKEMTDRFYVTIYNDQGDAVSKTYADTLKDYAVRYLETGEKQAYKTVMVDMLNYGAEAQKAFNYNTGNLANAGLTAEQLELGTTGEVEYGSELNVNNCPVDYKANVKMANNLQFMMAFSGINESMRAVVSFEKWNGEEKNITIAGEKFVESGRFHYFIIEETVIADGRQPITCRIYDGETLVCEVTDSIASYAGRTQSNESLYEAIVKFSDSAKAYLQSKNTTGSN